VSIRIAANVLIASGAYGSYKIRTFYAGIGEVVTGNYVDHFNEIRLAGCIGPEVNLGYNFELKHGGALKPRVSFFLSPYPMFKYSIDTPMNPMIHRFSLDVVYTFSQK
jgi:hypothetical protein